jgi:futalosine hydrolase
MAFLLCAATEQEIKPTLQYIEQENLSEIDVLITGVGLTAATYQLTKWVSTTRPEIIIQAGVAGAINKRLKLGETVVVKKEQIGDLGVYENERFSSIFDLQLADANKHPWNEGMLVNNGLDYFKIYGLNMVNGVTVNEITTDRKRITYYEKYGSHVETLEGAALHYIGLMENIKFLQLRSISNYAGERDKNKWFLQDAITNLNKALQSILKQINP